MASHATQAKLDSKKPAAGSDPPKRVKPDLRIERKLPYKNDDDPVTCKLVRGSPVTAIQVREIRPPAKPGKAKTGPSAVPMDSLLAPKTAKLPPLPFRRGEASSYRPPRFHRDARPHCPEKLKLSKLPKRKVVTKTPRRRRVVAVRGTAPRPTPIPSPAAPIKENPAPKQIPFTNPQSPAYYSSGSLPEIMTRQKKKRMQRKQRSHNGIHYGEVDQARSCRVSIRGGSSDDEESMLYEREERREYNSNACEDFCLIIAIVGMMLTIFCSLCAAISELGRWLVSATTPPSGYFR